MNKPVYQFTQPFPVVGTEEYKTFRNYLWEVHEYHTRGRMTTLKDEYLIQYWNEYCEIRLEVLFDDLMLIIHNIL